MTDNPKKTETRKKFSVHKQQLFLTFLKIIHFLAAMASFDDEDTLLMWDTISRTPSTNENVIIVRVFHGAEEAVQYTPFKAGLREIQQVLDDLVAPKNIIVA